MNYIINVNEFEGPFDLLLHLVKTKQVDIKTMNTTQIIEDYLKYIHTWQDLNIDIASEYLVMAAELIHLKSKMILNLEDEEVVDDEFSINSEDDLKTKLEEYEKYKNLVPVMNDLKLSREEYFTKLPENISEYQNSFNNSNLTINDLQKALENALLREMKMKPLHTKITTKELSVTDKIRSIRKILKNKKKIAFLDIFDNFEKKNVIVTFLAILNMSKNQEIKLSQKDNFSNILIESRKAIWS